MKNQMPELECPICGDYHSTSANMIWADLEQEWELSKYEMNYLDRQQGYTCASCGSNLRSMAIAYGVMASQNFSGDNFLAFVRSVSSAEFSVLEINEAGTLTPLLSDLDRHTLVKYPDVDIMELSDYYDQFDVVIHSDTLEHVSNPLQGLEECYKALKPGGICCFTVPIKVNSLSKSRDGLSPSFHGSDEARVYLVHTEFGTDIWEYVVKAGFSACEMHVLEYPSGIAIVGRKGPGKTPIYSDSNENQRFTISSTLYYSDSSSFSEEQAITKLTQLSLGQVFTIKFDFDAAIPWDSFRFDPTTCKVQLRVVKVAIEGEGGTVTVDSYTSNSLTTLSPDDCLIFDTNDPKLFFNTHETGIKPGSISISLEVLTLNYDVEDHIYSESKETIKRLIVELQLRETEIQGIRHSRNLQALAHTAEREALEAQIVDRSAAETGKDLLINTELLDVADKINNVFKQVEWKSKTNELLSASENISDDNILRERLVLDLSDFGNHVAALKHSSELLLSQQNTLSWRLTKPFRLGTKVAKEIALLCQLSSKSFQLSPNEALVKADGRWNAANVDPQFMLAGDCDFTRSEGLWAISLVGISVDDAKYFSPVLYQSLGGGFSEGNAVKMNALSPDYTTLIHMPGSVDGLRLDPSEQAGNFKLDSVKAVRVSKLATLFHVILQTYRYAKSMRLSAKSEIRGVWQQITKDGIISGVRNIENYLSYQQQNEHVARANSYQDWLDGYGTRKTEVKQQFREFAVQPKISIVLPVYDPKEALLQKCVQSVLNQEYQNWELCIANDGSKSEYVEGMLDSYCAADSRIKVIHRRETGHISKASNSAAALATGDFVAFLDHDDEISSDALMFLVNAVNDNPQAKFIYSDEDKIDESGVAFDPHFKSDWNPELLLAQNYICHFTAIKKSLFDSVGGFRVGFEGSQDHDLFLRCTNRIADMDIIHVSEILYHWRATPGSTALDPSSKEYAAEAGLKAVKAAVLEQGLNCAVDFGRLPFTYHVRHLLAEAQPLVSIIIPTKDRLDLLRQAVDSILDKTNYSNYTITIVDNGSVELATLEYFAEIVKDARVTVLPFDAPFNFSAINNFAVKHCDGEVLALVNNDIEVISENWLLEMVGQATRKEVGCVGAKLYYPDDRIQHGGVILGIGGVAGHSHKYYPRRSGGYFGRLQLVQNLSAVTAACLVVRKEVFVQVGGLDEENLTVAFNDVDFCLKVVAAGYRNIWTPYAELIHHESVSRGAEDSPKKALRFASEVEYMLSKWSTQLSSDPYYNKNLCLEYEDFRLN